MVGTDLHDVEMEGGNLTGVDLTLANMVTNRTCLSLPISAVF